jgi:hypothetical protein
VGNLKNKPGHRAASAGTHQAAKVVDLGRRSGGGTAVAEESYDVELGADLERSEPYFLPGDAQQSRRQNDEATSVEVRRSRAAENPTEDKGDAVEAPVNPVFRPEGGPKKASVEKIEAKRTPSSRPPSDFPARHPRFRALIAIPVISATLLSIAFAVTGPDRAELYRAELAIVEGLGFWGCLAAALIFDSGDYLRRAWLLEMSCYGLIFVGDLTLTTGVFSNQPWTPLANGVLTLAANAGAMGGTFLLARAGGVAGIAMPGSAATRRGVKALALAFALLAAGPAAIISLRRVIEGDSGGLMYFASCMGDIFCFVLIAPLLLTTVAMRGGLLAWPWGFMTASGLAWLTFDAVQTLSPIVFGISAEDARPVLEVARCLACTCAFSAGLAQRWTILAASD